MTTWDQSSWPPPPDTPYEQLLAVLWTRIQKLEEAFAQHQHRYGPYDEWTPGGYDVTDIPDLA